MLHPTAGRNRDCSLVRTYHVPCTHHVSLRLTQRMYMWCQCLCLDAPQFIGTCNSKGDRMTECGTRCRFGTRLQHLYQHDSASSHLGDRGDNPASMGIGTSPLKLPLLRHRASLHLGLGPGHELVSPSHRTGARTRLAAGQD